MSDDQKITVYKAGFNKDGVVEVQSAEVIDEISGRSYLCRTCPKFFSGLNTRHGVRAVVGKQGACLTREDAIEELVAKIQKETRALEKRIEENGERILKACALHAGESK